MPQSTNQELVELKNKLCHMTYEEAVVGVELYNCFGGKVLEQQTTAGQLVAVKAKSSCTIRQSEGDMMHYAATHGIRAPKVLGHYDVVTSEPKKPIAAVMVSERVPGVPLVDVWLHLSEAQQTSIKDQLRTELARMRSCTQPYIGRINNQPTYNPYYCLQTSTFGPFLDEKSFDDWCLERLGGGSLVRWKWQRLWDRERRQSTGTFVLTHGDLTPRNIMVQDGVVTGIIDWERSGFFPAYAEYAFAMKLCHSHEDWWIPVLEELLQPCSKQRLEFTSLLKDI